MKVTVTVIVTAPDGTEDIPGAIAWALDNPDNYPDDIDTSDWGVSVYDSEPGDTEEDEEASTAEWFAESKAAGCTGTGFDAENDTIAHDNDLPCPVHPGLDACPVGHQRPCAGCTWCEENISPDEWRRRWQAPSQG